MTEEVEKIKVVMDFEASASKIKFRKCFGCLSISLMLKVTMNKETGKTYCDYCKGITGVWKGECHPDWLPTWTDEHGNIQFRLPDELKGLREGEKLLIQRMSVYVPMEHLRFGSHGCHGHCCCFPQNVQEICDVLPRTKCEAIQVVKRYVLDDGNIGNVSFRVRRTKVMRALIWLKRHNRHYKDITIEEGNLDWLGDEEEGILPVTTIHLDDEKGKL